MHLSDGRRLQLHQDTKGAVYYQDNNGGLKRKTLRSNQKVVDGSGNPSSVT